MILALYSYSSTLAQDAVLDSLRQVIVTSTSDSTKIRALNALADALESTDPDEVIKISKQAVALAETSKIEGGLSTSYVNLAGGHRRKGQYFTALDYYNLGLQVRARQGDKQGVAAILGNIGLVYNDEGDYLKALEYHLKAKKVNQEIGHKKGVAVNLTNIGLIYQGQKNHEKALACYGEAIELAREMDLKVGIAVNLLNMGVIYYDQKEYDKALANYEESLKINEEVGRRTGVARNLGNMGLLYAGKADDLEKAGNLEEVKEIRQLALSYHLQSLELSREIGAKADEASELGNIGRIYWRKKMYTLAEEHLLEALDMSLDMDALSLIEQWNETLSIFYQNWGEHQEERGNTKLAIEYHKKSYQYRLSYEAVKNKIFNTDKSADMGRLEAKAEYDKQLLLKQAEQDKLDALAEEESKRQRLIIYGASFGLLMLIVFIFFLYTRFRLIRSQRNVIREQKAIVDEKNKDITDSINYAQKIQEAILATDKLGDEALIEHFVFFMPRDVVSGDFYWRHQTGDEMIWVAADCTGHGVPGAFMSMIGNSLLNDIILEKGIEKVDMVLNDLKQAIIDTLGQTGRIGEARDGMDLAICRYNIKTQILQFAGANNPLYLIPINKDEKNLDISILENEQTLELNGQVKIHDVGIVEIKGNKQPIGFEEGKDSPFTRAELKLEKGDVLYTFSDGYPDQFGGLRDKKFSYKRFRELVFSLHTKPMEEQKTILESTINEWKRDIEQVDDICVICVRI